jgi:MurNAc alpha-1-phosphate uridylyltransferase
MKAMILAAGQGTRLRPLTNHCPKPLLKVGQQRLIEHHIIKLAKAGFDAVIINTAYLGSMIEATLGNGERYGIDLLYSHEGEHALETGGGIAYAKNLLGEQAFLCISADIYTDMPFDNQFNLTQDVHLIMVNNPAHHAHGDFTAHQLGLSDDEQRYTYSGVAYLNATIFNQEKRAFPLIDVFNLAIYEKRINAQIYTGTWFDVGTASRLHAAHSHALKIEAMTN